MTFSSLIDAIILISLVVSIAWLIMRPGVVIRPPTILKVYFVLAAVILTVLALLGIFNLVQPSITRIVILLCALPLNFVLLRHFSETAKSQHNKVLK